MPNRLAGERSPYLLQHANNPVDWYPWGEEAFAVARQEDRPIFLSIGYSTCHWCHVMERESFEDASIAEQLNRGFVSIKVDREERPDLDRVYMTFVQATTGAGGWPMSVFLTPDLKPFFGGTYFPPAAQWGRPGFPEVLTQITSAWGDGRDRIRESADALVGRLREATGTDERPADGARERAPVADRSAVDAGVAAFGEAFDRRHGGFGGAPKFPRPSELIFLLRAFALTRNHLARQMAVDTLRAMALGGVRDHVGGGFHRYSVDAEWRVPHFEKMLYDQAQIAIACLEAAQASGDPFYAAVAEDTLDYVRRDLTSPDGGFYSAEDADSADPDAPAGAHAEKREGAFYVWTAAEIDRLFGDEADVIRRRFGIQDDGNAPADPQGEFRGRNILYVSQAIEDVAARSGRTLPDVMGLLARARQTLFDARTARPRPHLDDKIITAWNGLMMAACARAARVLVASPRRGDWLHMAERAAGFVEAHLWRSADRRLLRRYRDGEAGIDAFCEDYACLIWGLLELFQATGAARWLSWARELTDRQVERFRDPHDGGWFSTAGDDASVLLRLKEDYDGAEPAAASVTVQNLLTLAHLVFDPRPADLARRTLERYGPAMGRVARVMPFMLANVAAWHARTGQMAIVGPRDSEATMALERAVADGYRPWLVQIPIPADRADAGLVEQLPWAAAFAQRDGRPTAYRCEAFACQAPVTSASVLTEQLDAVAQPVIL